MPADSIDLQDGSDLVLGEPVAAAAGESMDREKERPSLRALALVVRAVPGATLLAGLALVALILATSGIDPVRAAQVLFAGALGSATGLGVTSIKVCPLLIAGLGITIAVRANRWNLGAQGQMYCGGLCATVVAVYVVPYTPSFVIVPLSLLGAAGGGALWILVPALLRARRGITELITTLLLNFVAIDLITVLVQGPLTHRQTAFPQSYPIPPAGQLPGIWPGTQAHLGVVIALVIGLAVSVLLNRTPFGFELKAIGLGERAAHFTGIQVEKRATQALLLSGALAGVAGGIEILAIEGMLVPGFESGYGFDAVAVALLGQASVLGTVVAGLFFAVLLAGAPAMDFSLGISNSLVGITQGLVITAVVVGWGLQLYLTRRLAGRLSR